MDQSQSNLTQEQLSRIETSRKLALEKKARRENERTKEPENLTISNLLVNRITAGEVKKLQEAGLHTIEAFILYCPEGASLR